MLLSTGSTARVFMPFWWMLVSAAIGVVSAVLGLYASYYLNVSSGGAIVLVATLIFVLAFLFAPRDGIVWRLRRRAAVRG